MRWGAAVLFAALSACPGGDRSGLTADSAALQSGTPRPDSVTAGAGGSTTDTVDSLRSGDSLMLALPTLVLRTDSAAGSALYLGKGKCLSCHGAAGAGVAGIGSNLQDTVWTNGDGSFPFIHRVVAEGIARPKAGGPGMPAFGRTIAPEEIYRISAYTYALSHPAVVVDDTTRVPLGDTLHRPPPPPR